jgi:hypothetical protein
MRRAFMESDSEDEDGLEELAVRFSGALKPGLLRLLLAGTKPTDHTATTFLVDCACTARPPRPPAQARPAGVSHFGFRE